MRPCFLTASLLALTACLATPPGDDFDGDGYSYDVDCDDDDATVNPGAAEIWYDGVDQNCDQASDYDQDGDGFDSHQHGGLDCDDERGEINPDAEETWYDGKDQNCDGADDYDQDGDGHQVESHGGDDCEDGDAQVNPDAEETWYDGVDQDCDSGNDYDQDGDGWECMGGVSEGCPKDHVGEDCDDLENAVGPGKTEYVDGVDNDCNGIQDDVPWHDRSDVEDWSVGIMGEGDEGWGGLGAAVSSWPYDVCSPGDRVDGDFEPNADTQPDLLVSAPVSVNADKASFTEHAVYLVPGDSAELLEGEVDELAVLRIEEIGDTASVDTHFGAGVEWVPDLDGDARPEILVEAPARDSSATGRVYLYTSGSWIDEPTKVDNLWSLPHTAWDYQIMGQAPGDGMGQVLVPGDLDGDGRSDLTVGEPAANSGSGGESWSTGAVRLFFGPSSDELDKSSLLSISSADLTIWGDREAGKLGEVRPAGLDIDQDGDLDLAVSTPWSTADRGIVAIWSGASIQTWSGTGPEIGDLDRCIVGITGSQEQAGELLAAGGDLNGDGYPELVTSARNATDDFLFLVLDGDTIVQGPQSSSTADTLLCSLALANPGDTSFRVDATGDFNKDAYADLALGVPPLGQFAEGGYAGVVYGWSGLSGTLVDSDVHSGLDGPAGSLLGTGAVRAMDMTGDGVSELVLGGPGYTSTGSYGTEVTAGMLWILDPTRAWPE